ncbi:MAG: glycosyltransferase [Pseudomonadota bacterium]
MSRLRSLLDTATMLIRQGDFDKACALLAELETADDPAALGPRTALGVPRRLQAVQLRLAKARGDALMRSGLQHHLVPPPELLAPLFAVDAQGRRARVAAASAPVPKVVHQIWVGGPHPETVEIWQEFAARHGWAHRLWREADLDALGVTTSAAYRAMADRGDFPGAVDVARYAILATEGGVYLDCDWLPVGDQPFEAVFPMSGLTALAETVPRLTGTGSPFLNNSVLAAPRDHPAFTQLLRVLPDVIAKLPRGPAWWVTGPLVFTLAARAGPVTVLDQGIEGGKAPKGATRKEALGAAALIAASDDPAFLYGWKPW